MADDLSDFDRSPADPAGRKPAGGGRVAGSVRPPPPKLLPLRAGSASPAVGAGAAVGSLFHRALALCFFAAFASLFVQVDLLLGPDGLLPVAAHVERLVKTGHGSSSGQLCRARHNWPYAKRDVMQSARRRAR